VSSDRTPGSVLVSPAAHHPTRSNPQFSARARPDVSISDTVWIVAVWHARQLPELPDDEAHS